MQYFKAISKSDVISFSRAVLSLEQPIDFSSVLHQSHLQNVGTLPAERILSREVETFTTHVSPVNPNPKTRQKYTPRTQAPDTQRQERIGIFISETYALGFYRRFEWAESPMSS